MSPLPQLGAVNKLNKTESAQENLQLASSGATKKVRMQDGVVVREPRHAPQHPFDSREYTLQSKTNAPIFQGLESRSSTDNFKTANYPPNSDKMWYQNVDEIGNN